MAISRRHLLPPGSLKSGASTTARQGSGDLIGASTRLPLDSDQSKHRRSEPIARNQNTYAKRKREMEKKQKAEDKRMRRTQRKAAADEPDAVRSQAETPARTDQLERDAD